MASEVFGNTNMTSLRYAFGLLFVCARNPTLILLTERLEPQVSQVTKKIRLSWGKRGQIKYRSAHE